MLQKLIKKKLGELSRHLCESPSEVGSDLGAFLVPSTYKFDKALKAIAKIMMGTNPIKMAFLIVFGIAFRN